MAIIDASNRRIAKKGLIKYHDDKNGMPHPAFHIEKEQTFAAEGQEKVSGTIPIFRIGCSTPVAFRFRKSASR